MKAYGLVDAYEYVDPWYWLEVSGQLHAPASLHPVKEPPILILLEAGWTPELV
jgi:hypothetical protein